MGKEKVPLTQRNLEQDQVHRGALADYRRRVQEEEKGVAVETAAILDLGKNGTLEDEAPDVLITT